MKLHLLSDLHLEFSRFSPPKVEADAVILTGDIGTGLIGLYWAAQHYRDIPVVYVPGNHEFYGYDVDVWFAGAREFLKDYPHITLCAPGSILLEKPGESPVRILGATLWTDFALYGAGRQVSSMISAKHGISDYQLIHTQGRLLQCQDTTEWHRRDLNWLVTNIQEAKSRGETVVVATHHSPTERGSSPIYQGSPLSPAFCSNLEALAAAGDVAAWIFGHTHYNPNLLVGDCRVISNQRGYPLKGGTFEAGGFQPDLVIEV